MRALSEKPRLRKKPSEGDDAITAMGAMIAVSGIASSLSSLLSL
jgi:hypothetical protein